MPQTENQGLKIEYEVTGPDDAKPILLIPGLGMQLTSYSKAFVDTLVSRGFRVIRMDNRDMGLSAGPEGARVPDQRRILSARLLGRKPDVPYTLDDMATDAVAVLDDLGVGRAHVAGWSMGGMIAQLVAINHPARCLSLTSVMSTTGHPLLPRPRPEAQAVLGMRRANPATHRERFLDEAVEIAQVLGSPGFPEAPEAVRERAALNLDRAYRPAGFARQYAAILAAPHRRKALSRLRLPSAVIHGTDDPLVPIAAGRDTARSLPGCDLVEIPGMGHNLPEQLNDPIAQVLTRLATRSDGNAAGPGISVGTARR